MASCYRSKCVKFIISRALRPALDRVVKCKNTLANRRKCCSSQPATAYLGCDGRAAQHAINKFK